MDASSNLLALLHQHQVDFVIIGGFAGVVYGSAFVTNDIDVCCHLDPATIEKLRVALHTLSPKHRLTPQRLSFLDFPADISTIKNLYLQTDLGNLDVFSEVLGIGDFESVKRASNGITIHGDTYRLLTLDALIKSKEAMGRPKDLAAVAELKVIRERSQKA